MTCLTPALQTGAAARGDKGFPVRVHFLFELTVCGDERREKVAKPLQPNQEQKKTTSTCKQR